MQTLNLAGGQAGQGARGGYRGGMRGRFGGAAIGKVVSSDSNSVTIQMQDGSSKIINITGSTTISKTATAAITDIQSGARIAAFGTTNSDGSINAQNIQINPMQRGGVPGSGQGGQSQPTQSQ